MKRAVFRGEDQSRTDSGMMTIAACLWFGLFPLLNGGSYAHITKDKWWIMMILCGVTTLCFGADLVLQAVRRRHILPTSAKRSGSKIVIRHETAEVNYRLQRRKSDEGGSFRGYLSGLPKLPLTVAAVLLLWMPICCIFGPYGPETWLIGASVRREGLLTQAGYLGLFALFAASKVRLRPVLISAAVGVAAFFTIVMLQRGGGNPLGLYPRGTSYALNPEFQGTIGNIDMDAGYLCMMAGFLLFGCIELLKERGKIFAAPRSGLAEARRGKTISQKESAAGKGPSRTMAAAGCAIGTILAVCLILTMDVEFGVFTLIALAVITAIRFLPKRFRMIAVAVLLILALLLVWFWPGTEGALWEIHEIMHGRARMSFGHNRLAVWVYSLKLSRERMLLGGGSDTFVYRFNEFLEMNGYTIPTEQDGVLLPAYFDNPHNEYLAQLVNHGLPGLVLFVLLIGAALMGRKTGKEQCLSAWKMGAICYTVQAFFSFSVCLVAPMFWVMLGIAAGNGER